MPPSRNRKSFAVQMGIPNNVFAGEKSAFFSEINSVTDDITATFESKFAPKDMRQLALVAHNHMKPAM